MNELALFAGIGGGLLGSYLAGWRTVCAVEIDRFCRDRLFDRQRDGLLEPFPVWDDIRAFDGRPFRGVVDLVSAGFPCQPFSLAGRQAAGDDPRNMWPDTARVLGEVRPRWALLENVPGLLAPSHGYFGTILSDLAELGFDVAWRVVSASDVGAPHLRKRLWILAADAECGARNESEPISRRRNPAVPRDDGASWPLAHAENDGTGRREQLAQGGEGAWTLAHADSGRREGERIGRILDGERAAPGDDADRCRGKVADPAGEGCEDVQGCAAKPELDRRGAPSGGSWWSAEPDVGRVAHGVPSRVDRLRALGNAQVPAVVRRVLEDAGLYVTSAPK